MFTPGDEIVCIDDGSDRPTASTAASKFIRAGQHYIVRDVCTFSYADGPGESVFLVGVARIWPHKMSPWFGQDVPFTANRFRPVKRESIEIFRAMCTSTKPFVEV